MGVDKCILKWGIERPVPVSAEKPFCGILKWGIERISLVIISAVCKGILKWGIERLKKLTKCWTIHWTRILKWGIESGISSSFGFTCNKYPKMRNWKFIPLQPPNLVLVPGILKWGIERSLWGPARSSRSRGILKWGIESLSATPEDTHIWRILKWGIERLSSWESEHLVFVYPKMRNWKNPFPTSNTQLHVVS